MIVNLGDCKLCADELGLDPRIIQAVASVESNGDVNAFLFEPHVFSRITNRRYDISHPDISYPVWDRTKYPKSKVLRQRQFESAIHLEPLKAYEAASWGIFQIMGFNYKTLKYGSALAMATDLKSSIEANVIAFGRMIRHMGLIDTLRNHEWDKFARVYNGPGYKLNNYHLKIANAFADVSRVNA